MRCSTQCSQCAHPPPPHTHTRTHTTTTLVSQASTLNPNPRPRYAPNTTPWTTSSVMMKKELLVGGCSTANEEVWQGHYSKSTVVLRCTVCLRRRHRFNPWGSHTGVRVVLSGYHDGTHMSNTSRRTKAWYGLSRSAGRRALPMPPPFNSPPAKRVDPKRTHQSINQSMRQHKTARVSGTQHLTKFKQRRQRRPEKTSLARAHTHQRL
jgi:hypothetical protein